MSWRILSDRAWSDLERLTEEERLSISADLMDWVEAGPPRANRRELAGAEVFQDDLPSGFEVTYFVDDTVPYAAIIRVRRLP